MDESATSIDDCYVCGHSTEGRVGDLVAMGFDYEDVLGDELASPLDFTSDWTSTGATSITENSFQVSGSGIGVYFSLEADKKYKIKVSNVSGDISIRYRTSNGGAGTVAGNFDEFIIINTFNSTTPNIYLRANSETTVTVGDVTIKELTEDVVVPYSGEGSLLLEPQSTNLITYSEDFSEWTPTNIVSTEDTIIAPDGTTTADKIAGTSVTLQHRVNFTSTNVSGATTFSFFAKSAEYTSCWARIGFSNAYFDLENAVSSQGAGITSSIENYGNGWYRCIMTKASSSANEVCRINLTTSYLDTSDFLGDNTSGIYLWGGQHEQLSYATSYIPTNGSTVTRLADVCNNSGNSDLINSTEGVLYAEISALADDLANRSISISDGSTNNRVNILYSNSTNQIRVIVLVGGSTKFDQNYNVTSITDMHKIALKYKADDFALWVDGVERLTDTSGTIFAQDTLNELAFNIGSGILPFYGNVKCVAVFEALSDTELQKLTTI